MTDQCHSVVADCARDDPGPGSGSLSPGTEGAPAAAVAAVPTGHRDVTGHAPATWPLLVLGDSDLAQRRSLVPSTCDLLLGWHRAFIMMPGPAGTLSQLSEWACLMLCISRSPTAVPCQS